MSTTLAVTTVPAYLRERGLSFAPDDHWTVQQLTGGVSGAVYSAFDGVRRVVVKQSLDKLDVEDDWSAPRERILNEARVMSMLGDIIPTHSPAALDVDEETLTLTMEHAPVDWGDWKTELLAGDPDLEVAAGLGRMIGSVHTATSEQMWSLPPDDGAAGFLGLRIEPFHYAVAERAPDYAEAVEGVADRILSTRRCLVHGDFSPKNVLVAPRTSERPRRFWLIDDEVGHRGDPTFDVAFFLSHFALKRIRAGHDRRAQFDRAGHLFVEAYEETGIALDDKDLSEQIGCLMLSRVIGRSRVKYLTEEQQERAFRVGGALLTMAEQYDRSHPLEILSRDED